MEVGDWVYVVSLPELNGQYVQLCNRESGIVFESKHYGVIPVFESYGTKWLAYKNKEQAEAKGEIVELPCKVETLHIGDTVYYIQEYFNDATLKHEYGVKRTVIDYIAKDYIEVNNGVWLSVDKFWTVPEEAERRLAELKGE